MENSFNKQIVLCLWQLVNNNQPQSILSNSLSFVGCYGNGSANLFQNLRKFLNFLTEETAGRIILAEGPLRSGFL